MLQILVLLVLLQPQFHVLLRKEALCALVGVSTNFLTDRSVAIECLKAALTNRKSTPAKIASAAKKYGAWNQTKSYLEAVTANR